MGKCRFNRLIILSIENYEQEIYAADGITKTLNALKTDTNSADLQIIGFKALAHLAQDGI